ncbi:hypothetical protein J2W27_000948 [Variovorax boronicumulans]|uniref:Ig-like domain-containing protein n=1 Tax=Variovorax boronicumulans TaxID=436515 RepID=UPI0027885C43|nr:Ig-like domain-containing protein [Variovorax boronicumulans]MDP9908855.1 hypothetical protein [Variovorax boronicumulans]
MPSEKIQVAIDHPSSTFAAPPAIVGGALDDAGDIQNPIAHGGVTDDRQPGFHGQGTPGDTIVIRDNGNEIGTTEVDANGTWTFTPSTDLLEGQHAITIVTRDDNGNESTPSPAFNFEIDVTPPDASRLNVSGFTDNVGGVTGNVISGGTTDETRPLLSGISNGTPGHTVTVMVKDATGTHELGLATIGENGQWTFQVDTPLSAGLNTFMLVERDAAGNETMPTGRYKVTVSTDKPNAPVIDSVFDDVGEPHMLQPGEATNDARPTLAGTAQANHTVKFYDGSTYLGKAVADDSGKWSFTPQIDLPDGTYNITATSTSPVGQTSDASSAWNFVVDTTAPTQTATVTDIGKDSGFDVDDYLTNDGSAGRLMMGQLSAPLAAGDTLQVSTDGGKTWKAAFVSGTQWSAQDDNSHADSWTVQTRVVDEAGNAGAVQSQAVTLDTVASQEPGSLTITGSANNSVTVAFDPAGVKVGDRVSLSNLYLRYEHTLTAEDVAAGKVTFSPVFINEGIGNTVANTNPIAAAILDAAGNPSARSLVVVENFDAWGGPMASADRGLVKIEALEAGKTFTVATGSALSPLLANASNVLHMTSNVKLSLKQEASELAFQSTSISGTGGVFEFYNSAGVLLGTRQAPAQGSLETLVFAAPAGQAVSYVTYKNAGAGSGVAIDNLTVKHVDQSGWFSPNSVVASQDVNGGGGYYGTDGADVFTFGYPNASVWVKEGIQGNGGIDTLKLTKAGQVLDLTALAGKLTSVEVIDLTGTGNNTLTLSLAEVLENGTVDQFVANGRVQMMVKGNAGDAVSLLDLLPNGTDPGDWVQGANVTLDGVVYEIYQHSGFKADLLVQQGVAVTLQITIDRVMDDVGAITGAIAKGGVTDDTTPTLSGKAAAGGTVKVYDGSTFLGSTTADAKGHWSFTPGTPLSEGVHGLSATVTPVGGSESVRTAVFELTVDSVAPTQTATVTDIGKDSGFDADDYLTNDGSAGRLLQGKLSAALGAGETLQVSTDGGATWKAAFVAGDQWSAQDDNSHTSNWTVQTRVVDAAGNAGLVQSQAMAMDTVAPATPTEVAVVAGGVEVRFNPADVAVGHKLSLVLRGDHFDYALTAADIAAGKVFVADPGSLKKTTFEGLPLNQSVNSMTIGDLTISQNYGTRKYLSITKSSNEATNEPEIEGSHLFVWDSTVAPVKYQFSAEKEYVSFTIAGTVIGDLRFYDASGKEIGRINLYMGYHDSPLGFQKISFEAPAGTRISNFVTYVTSDYDGGYRLDNLQAGATPLSQFNVSAAIVDSAGNVSQYTASLLPGKDTFDNLTKINAGASHTTTAGVKIEMIQGFVEPSNYSSLYLSAQGIVSFKIPTPAKTVEIEYGNTHGAPYGKVEFYSAEGVLLGTKNMVAHPDSSAGMAKISFSSETPISYVKVYGQDSGTAPGVNDAILIGDLSWSGVEAGSNPAQQQTLTEGSVGTLHGGSDNNEFIVTDVKHLADSAISGNGGTDTLKLTGANQTLDLTALAGKVSSVEIIDLTGTGNNTLKLSLADVMNNGAKDQFVADGRVQMMVKGNAGDAVTLSDVLPNGTDPGDWVKKANVTVSGVVYEVYQHSGFDAELLVQQGVTVTLQNAGAGTFHIEPELEAYVLDHATMTWTDSDDTLIARLGFADRLEGGAGNDTFTKVGTGDTVHGGAGDDTIRINSGDFAHLDGGLGIDTLVMDGTAMHIDLSALGAKVQGFEKFDLGAGGNTLALSAQDLLAGGARDMVTADDKVQMLVNGANGDVNLLGGDDSWTQGGNATVSGVTYSVYTNLAGTAELLVEDKVHVTIL